MEESTEKELAIAKPGLLNDSRKKKAILIAVAFILALVSIFALAPVLSDPATYAGIIETLDEKKSNVMALAGVSAGLSTAITLIPGDVAGPVAEQLAELSTAFMAILAVLYLEKYLLTTIGFVVATILIPVCCALFAGMVLSESNSSLKTVIGRVLGKVVALSMVLILTVPTSVFITDQIDATYEASMTQTIEQAEVAIEGAEEENKSNAENGKSSGENKQGIFNTLKNSVDEAVDTAASVVSTLTKSGKEALDNVQNQLNNMIEAFAIMIVTSCLIPILVLAFYLWTANLVLGINVDAPVNALKSKANRLTKPKKGSGTASEEPKEKLLEEPIA